MQSVEAANPVLAVTDIGRNPDDAETVLFLQGTESLELVAAAVCDKIPTRRAFLLRQLTMLLGNPDLVIGEGSAFPLGQESDILERYHNERTIGGKTYEGEGLIECFPTAVDVITGAIQKYGKALHILAIAPMTDLAKAELKHPGLLGQAGGIYIQGQATVENGRLVPDLKNSYNLAEDPKATSIVFGCQDELSFTMTGKFAAYAATLDRDNFRTLAASGHLAGAYLERHASEALRVFAHNRPDIFRRTYYAAPDQVDSVYAISHPYDVLAAMAMTDQGLLVPRRVGRHTLIGMSAEDTGVSDPAAVKTKMMHTMLAALNKPA